MQFIKATDLTISPDNVRKTSNKESLEELKASILAHGVLQNLIVKQVDDGFQVLAGGRRLQAIQALIASGALKNDFEVACQLKEGDNHELSLAENVVRVAMHPADECEAYAVLAEKGTPIDSIAINFGVKPRYVEARLRLARLDKAILKAFRKGEITSDQAMAFTISDDKKKQLQVFKRLANWDDGDRIRASLTEGLVDGDSKIAKFVGREDYVAAGGIIREDLFGEDVYFENESLLKELAEKKLQATADEVKEEGWLWVEIVADGVYEFTSKMGREYNAEKLSKTKKALMGAVVTISYAGAPDCERGFIRREDADKYRKLTHKADPAVNMPAGREKGAISESHMTSLKQQRQHVMQNAIANQKEIAENLFSFAIVRSILSEKVKSWASGSIDGLAIRFDNKKSKEYVDAKASAELAELRKGIPMEWDSAKSEAEAYEAFIELPSETKKTMVAIALAHCVEASLSGTKSALEAALFHTGVDVDKFWRPTKENYLEKLTTTQLIELGDSTLGKGWQGNNKKKTQLVDILHEAFANPYQQDDVKVADKLAAWLPKDFDFENPIKQAKGKKAA